MADFYSGFLDRQQQIQQQPMQEIQQASGALGLQAALQQQAKKQAFEKELAGLGPDATPEQRIAVATKYATPDKLIEVQQKAVDRKDTAQARADQFQQTLDLKAQDLERKKAEFESRAADAQSRAQFEQWYKGQALVLQQQQFALNGELKRLGLGIQQQAVDARREALANKPLTEVQGKSATYGSRATQSDKVLNSLEDKTNLQGLHIARALPGGNYLLGQDQQRVDQAQRDFVNAVLRQESGAAISASEFENAQKQYFAQPGDSKEVRAQKRANRQLAIDGFERQAGPAGPDIRSLRESPLLPGTAPAAPGGLPGMDAIDAEIARRRGARGGS